MTITPYEPPERLPAIELDQRAQTWVTRLRAAAEIAAYIGGTEFVPDALRNRPEAITAAILYGEEVGLEPMRALAMVAHIKGKPAMLAEGQRSLILAAGHELWFEESTITRAIAAGRRRGSDRIARITWTLDDAKRAGLAGQHNYQRYPAEMLRARASAALARAMFADVIGGMAAVEELEGEPDNGVTPTVQLETERPKRPATRRKRAPATEPAPAPPPSSPSPSGGAQAPEPLPPPDTQPKPEIPDEPAMTGAQQRQIFALMRDIGIDNREDRLAYTIKTIGRTIQTSNELTISEAGKVIEALTRWQQLTPEEQATINALEELTDEPDVP
jgi:hypothetical protein